MGGWAHSMRPPIPFITEIAPLRAVSPACIGFAGSDCSNGLEFARNNILISMRITTRANTRETKKTPTLDDSAPPNSAPATITIPPPPPSNPASKTR